MSMQTTCRISHIRCHHHMSQHHRPINPVCSLIPKDKLNSTQRPSEFLRRSPNLSSVSSYLTATSPVSLPFFSIACFVLPLSLASPHLNFQCLLSTLNSPHLSCHFPHNSLCSPPLHIRLRCYSYPLRHSLVDSAHRRFVPSLPSAPLHPRPVRLPHVFT